MTSPCSLTWSWMNRLDGLILSRSVHQRKMLVGAGYPFPRRLTQNESFDGRREEVGRERHPLLCCRLLDEVECPSHVVDDDRGLDEGVGRDDVDGLRPLLWVETCDGEPDELERGRGVLAAGVA